ncbi:1559_t:CDS:2, partial [Entrophospora sp. SA101]
RVHHRYNNNNLLTPLSHSDELRQQQQALQIYNTPEYIISSPQLFLSIKHISPPGTNSPSYSPISNPSYSPYYFHHSTTNSSSPFPICCQCLFCIEAGTSGSDDSTCVGRSGNCYQIGECSDYSDYDDNSKEEFLSSPYKSQESTPLVYHHHDINGRSPSSLGAFTPINMGGISPVNIYGSPMAANGNSSSSSPPSSYKQQQQQHLSSTMSYPLAREVRYNNNRFS